LHGSWEKTLGHHTALLPRADEDENEAKLNVRWAVTKWIEAGTEPEKIMLGLAAYGRSLTLSDPTSTELGAPVKSAGAEGKVVCFYGQSLFKKFSLNSQSYKSTRELQGFSAIMKFVKT
jgi:GH18 family chitinase